MTAETKRYVTRAILTTRVVFGITLLVVGAALLLEWSSVRADAVGDPLYLLWAIIASAGGLWDLVGAFRGGIWADPRGITVRDTVRTRRLAWADIASFRMDAPAGWAAKCLRIHLRNGGDIKVKAIVEPRFGPKYKTSIVQELNEALVGATMPVRPDAR